MALTKVSGDFIQDGSITQGHLHASHGITTSDIGEGSNLYFTTARVDSRIGDLSTSDLSEGTNLYYTDARTDARIALQVGSNLDLSSKSTSDLSEGTNLYYTQARFNTAFTAKSTSDLSEGTNLYYTDARADARITAADTDSLSEGSTNLYYTDARADARVALIVDSAPGTLDTLNELAAALGDDANFSTTVTNSIATKLPLAGGTMTGRIIQTQHSTTLGNSSYASEAAVTAQATNTTNAYPGYGFHKAGQLGLFLYATDRSTLRQRGDDGTDVAIWNTGDFSSTNVSNWNTAYGWGDHASAGYITSFDITTQTDPKYLRSDANDTATGTINFTGNMTAKNTKFLGGTSYNENIRMHPSSNNYSSLVLGAVSGDSGAGTGQWTLVRYPSPTHQHKFTIRHNSTDHVTITTAGNLTNHVDTRSHILYSSSDTSYYLYPNNQLSLKVYGEIANSNVYQGSMQPGALNIGRTDTNYGWDGTTWASDVRLGMLMNFSEYYEIGFHDSGDSVNSFVYYNGVDFEMGRDIGWGTNHFTFTESVRSPWFYDSGNTGYYVNPAFTSNLNALNVGGAAVWTSGNDGAGSGLDADLLDGVTSSGYHNVTSNPGTAGHGTISIGNNGSYSYVQSHAGQPLRLNPVGNQLQAASIYDYNDTTYYINPASESKIFKLWINNGGAGGVGWSTGLNMGSGSNYWNQIQDAGIARQRNFGTGGYDWFSSGGTQQMSLSNGGVLFAAGDMRAPVFYDSNDTGYYVNPNSQSSLWGVAVRGDTHSTNTENQIFFWGSGNTTTSAIGFKANGGNFANPTGTGDGYNTYFTMDTNGRGWVFRRGTGGANFTSAYTSGWILNNGVWQANASMRAPIFYDSNNTAYYADPSGLSVMHSLKLIKHQNHTPRWDFSAYVVESPHHYSTSSTGSMYIGESNYINIRNTADIHGDARSPIYYDRANTGYYTRPASSSSMYSIYTASFVQVGASGSSSLWLGGQSGNYFRFHTNNSDTYFDANVGNIYWRQGSSTRFYFYMTSANMTINGTLTQNSDERVKENIVEIPNAIDKIQAMRGVYYNRTDFNTDVTKVGVIAQEVEAVLPEVILEAPDTGLKSVAYAELTAVLINGIKEQQTIIDDLKARIEILENQ